MVTAIDTNVLLDVFANDATFAPASAECLRRCLREGVVVACGVVWAEVAAAFGEAQSPEGAMAALPITFSPLDERAASRAGELWRLYRHREGTRQRVLADFLIASHAEVHCDRLLTRDRGFYRAHFAGLVVLDPSRPS